MSVAGFGLVGRPEGAVLVGDDAGRVVEVALPLPGPLPAPAGLGAGAPLLPGEPACEEALNVACGWLFQGPYLLFI